ncbi:MAG: D-2-hydroxyacid dehydrogenase [Lachnospiraceae bacterium]
MSKEKIKRVLVTFPVNENQRLRLEQAAPEYRFVYRTQEELTEEELREASVIAGNVKPELLAKAEKLEWMQLNSAGYDNYIKGGILKDGVRLTNATGAYGPAVSEHMLAMVLALQKHLHTYAQNMQNHSWSDAGSVTSIDGARTLVLGLGDIGQAFCRKMKALGSHVTGIRRNTSRKPDCVDEIASLDRLDELLPQMDIVAVILPASTENYHLFSEKQFGKMKPGSIFINAGRGSLVDEKALVNALEKGTVGCAGLDVTDPEPLPQDSPLWDRKDVLITPHVAGGFHLQKTLDLIVEIFIDNMARFQQGKELNNLVRK